MNAPNQLHPFQQNALGTHPYDFLGIHQGPDNNGWTAPWMQAGANAAYAGAEYGGEGWTFGSNLKKVWTGISGAFQTGGTWDIEKIGTGVAAAGGAAMLIRQIQGDLQSARAADQAAGITDSDARVQALEMQLAELNQRALAQESGGGGKMLAGAMIPVLIIGGVGLTLFFVVSMLKTGNAAKTKKKE